VSNSRAVARWLIGLIVAPAFLTLFGKLILPRWRMPIGGRAALFLIVTMALGPGLLANVILKEHWGRSRPIDVTQFSGTDRFSPWWSPPATARPNCPPFIAGEPVRRRSGRWGRRPWRRLNGASSPMAQRLPLAPQWAFCASPAAGIFFQT
jgi:hypothetical protein